MRRRLLDFDWEAAAGAVAAIVAIVLHLVDVVEEDTLLVIILFILAVILIRDLRKQGREERAHEAMERAEVAMHAMQAAIAPPDAILIGPRRLRVESERFARRARGEMLWYNVCLEMFRPQQLFDSMLRPAIDNPQVSSVQFVLDEGARDAWRDVVTPKVAGCDGRDRVAEPRWTSLPEDVSFIVSETEDGGAEALLSFWGEPFMSRQADRQVPRYIFHVQSGSELIERLIELERLARG
jgi:hypothetical protein